jgi:hypothetical protein
MPSTEEIIQGLTYAANHYAYMAWIWHLLFLVLVILLISGRRPARNIMAILLALPIASVSTIAIFTSNPFNGIIFFLLTVILLIIGYRMPAEKVAIRADLAGIFGVLMILFGWVYPHFLHDASIWQYLYAAPVGLVPCPTLSIVIGFTLLFGGFGSRKWMLVLAIVGLFYGIIGFFRLGVQLDAGLIAGSVVLAIVAALPVKEGPKAQK